ncbi:MAG: acyl-CoA dehydrogenase [Pseudomonadota bacterium]
MEYLLTEEQRMLREMVAKFAKEDIAPKAKETDEHHLFPRDIINKAGELGLMGIAYPDTLGGAGMDYVSYMLAVEEISAVCASTGVIISAHSSLCIAPIYQFGTEEQKKKYMPDLCSGKKIGCFGLTEPSAGSDSGGTKTPAVLEGDTWILNGTKTFITNGKEAEVAVLFARTDMKVEPKTRGITAFIIEKGTKGFSVGKVESKLGINGSSTTELILNDCRIPKENLLGQLNKGFKVAMVTLDGGRLGIASQALGIAKAAIADATQYAKDRCQFDVPIASFQAIQWMLADMVTEYEAAWLLTYRASLMKDKGLDHTREAAMAKLKASEVANFCASKAIQILGGYGYMKEFNVERYFRDAKITELYEGTSEIQRLVIAAQHLKS